MATSLLRTLPALLLSLFAFSFAGCASTSALSGPLASALGDITGFSTKIGDWQSKLGSVVDTSALNQLSDFTSQAKNLGSSISGMTEGVSKAMSDPLGSIGSKLSDMGGLDVEKLRGLAPAAQSEAVNAFAGSAKGVGSMAQDFLKTFGS